MAVPPIDKRSFLLGSFTTVAAVGLTEQGSAALLSGPSGSAPPPAMDIHDSSGALALMSPPATQTADSIAVLWSKPEGVSVEGYDLFLDKTLVATTSHTDHTFKGLRAAKAHDISVRARVAGGSVLQSKVIRIATKPRSRLVDIAKFGAIGDGQTLNTTAIQKAIDACDPGGVVLVPAGTFLSGALFLKSDMTLHLEAGAVLLGSPETADYPVMKYRFEGRETDCYASLINTPTRQGGRWRNIAITGAGTINANGVALRKAELAQGSGKPGRAICIRDTDGLYLYGITVRQSPAWCVHVIYCTSISLNGVNIQSKYDETGKHYPGIVNGDGFDPDSCRDVFVFDCHISSEDDCIAIKSGRDAEGRAVGIPSENFRITHCRFTSGFGVAVGSEMSGGVRNVLVEDCVFEDTFGIASVKAPRGRGSMAENITYRDCTLTNRSDEHHDGRWFRGALYIDQYYSVAEPELHLVKPKDEGTSRIRNILFKNITLDTVGGNAIYFAGLPESPLQNIRLENVSARGVHGFIAYNIEGLVLDGVSVEARDGKSMEFVNVKA